MGFRKGFDRHMWPTLERMNKRKKLEMFLESVHVLDDFREVLTVFEYKIIYLKVTCERRTTKDLLRDLNDYNFHRGLKEEIIVNFGELSEKVLLTIYRAGIDKILDLVVFEQHDYTWEIVYQGRERNRERKLFPIHYHKGWHSHIVIYPERKPIEHTEEQLKKIRANRMLEAQSNGGLHDKEKRPVMAAQESAIEQMLEVEHE